VLLLDEGAHLGTGIGCSGDWFVDAHTTLDLDDLLGVGLVVVHPVVALGQTGLLVVTADHSLEFTGVGEGTWDRGRTHGGNDLLDEGLFILRSVLIIVIQVAHFGDRVLGGRFGAVESAVELGEVDDFY
jgi:hypothetical protein